MFFNDFEPAYFHKEYNEMDLNFGLISSRCVKLLSYC